MLKKSVPKNYFANLVLVKFTAKLQNWKQFLYLCFIKKVDGNDSKAKFHFEKIQTCVETGKFNI